MNIDTHRILIVEDDVIIGQLIRKYLLKFGHQVLDIVFDSERALDKIHSLTPDLVILDINILGQRDGIDVAEIIEEKYKVPYIFLTALSDDQTLQRAKKLSPIGYVVKPFKEGDLQAALVIGMSNYQRSHSNEGLNLNAFNTHLDQPLTEKEFEILLKVSQGFTNIQIALDEDLSKNTVKWHTQNIYAKLGVKNRTAATQFLLQKTNEY